MVAEAKDRITGNLLPGPSRVTGVNILVSQLDWMEQVTREHRVNRSDLVRRSIELLQQEVEREGIDAALLGKV